MFALPHPDYSRIGKYRDAFAQVDEATRVEVLKEFLAHVMKRYRAMLAAPKRDYEARIGPGDELLQALQADGCLLARIPAPLKDELRALALPLAEALEQRLESIDKPGFKDGQHRLTPGEHPQIFACVDGIFEQMHAYDACAAYARRRLKLARLTIQVNTARVTALKYRRIDEQGLPTPKTRYFHIDSDGFPFLKSLIYLEPVTLDRGPFRYVAGSHRWADEFELAVRKTNDKLGLEPKAFAALPAQLRLNTEFGDHMDPDGPEAEALLKAERPLCDGASDLILFDNNGVHRGGFVRKGRRYMMQCAFDPVE